jgi:hypothetical protein
MTLISAIAEMLTILELRIGPWTKPLDDGRRKSSTSATIT